MHSTTTMPARRAGFAVVLLVALLAATLAGAVTPAEAAAPPTISSLSPAGSDVLGNDEIRILGSGFTGATGVRFGSTQPALSFTVVSDTEIRAVNPPVPAPVVVNVFVDGPSGTSATSAATQFWYTPAAAPGVDGMSPRKGSTAGGTVVRIFGVRFQHATAVTFDGTPAPALTILSDTTIEVLTPPHAAGLVEVEVVNPVGTSTQLLTFEYVPAGPPVIAAVTPAVADAAGGTTLTLEGSGFTGATAVSFGGAGPATSFTVLGDNRITAVAPPHPAWATFRAVTLTVTAPTGTSNTWLLPYVGAPTVTEVFPSTGATSGGATVYVAGTTFLGLEEVTFGGTPATSWRVVGVDADGTSHLVATAPPHAAGTVDVVLHGPGGASTPSAASSFTYVEGTPPTISSISPYSGASTGGRTISLFGSGFTGATAVHFARTPASAFTVVSDSEIVVTTPPGPPRTVVNVFVTTPVGRSQLSQVAPWSTWFWYGA